MTRTVAAAALKEWLHDGQEIALLDVREHGQYGESHLFYAIPLPYSRLEIDAPRLVPRRSVRVVCCDGDGKEAAPAAAARLAAIGYTDVHVLQGGTRAWRDAGYALFAGVNVPSKTFGELVERSCHTPRIGAAQLAAMIERQEDMVVLDGRPLAEFSKMSIPTAICCPNGELALRIGRLAPDPSTRIVINCAGRTRSIIGAQTLINLGISNPVFALENGTQGWYLQDFRLEHGATRHYGDASEADARAEMRDAAQALAARHGAATVSAATVQNWASADQHTVFLCDVRTPEEFAQGSLAGAQHCPGGQLVQATDQFVGVRGARLVLFDSDGIRAATAASWLRQMGHQAFVLEGGLAGGLAVGLALPRAERPALAALPEIDAHTLARQLEAGEVVALDLRPSTAFRKGHVPASRWGIRPRLAALVAGEKRTVVLIAEEPAIAEAAALDLKPLGMPVRVISGGFNAWREAGLPVAADPASPADNECIDFLFFVHDRHDGNKEAARRYLAWECGLIEQMDERELAAFRIEPSESPSAQQTSRGD